MASDEPGWDADLYESRHDFVHRAAADFLDWLDPAAEERILDLGCGTGHLTDEIRARGAVVVGVDRSAEMLAEARRTYPDLPLVRGDARSVPAYRAFDAVFSNATLHWVSAPHAAATSIFETLQPGGRFVAEFGGTGNVETILGGLAEAMAAAGHDPGERNTFYFPSIGEYASVLETAGFEVRSTRLFDRPTPLDGGEDGLRDWFAMFTEHVMTEMTEAERDAVVADVEDRLRPVLWDGERWVADYRRLRVEAVRPA